MSQHTLHFKPAEGFRARSKAVVDNPFLRQSFRGAMDFLMSKRAAQFPDPEELESLRSLGEQIRQYNLGKLPELLLQLETKLTRNGINVHWAETPEEANAIIHGLIAARNGKLAAIHCVTTGSHTAEELAPHAPDTVHAGLAELGREAFGLT